MICLLYTFGLSFYRESYHLKRLLLTVYLLIREYQSLHKRTLFADKK